VLKRGLTSLPATTDLVVWKGGASTVLMTRHEWKWSLNWLGGVPPANPAGTVRYTDEGLTDSGSVETDRAVTNRPQ